MKILFEPSGLNTCNIKFIKIKKFSRNYKVFLKKIEK